MSSRCGVIGVTGPGSAPADAALSKIGRFLYVLAGGAGQIAIFAFNADGSLTPLGSVALPATALGLAAC
jgi:hypothetical protein